MANAHIPESTYSKRTKAELKETTGGQDAYKSLGNGLSKDRRTVEEIQRDFKGSNRREQEDSDSDDARFSRRPVNAKAGPSRETAAGSSSRDRDGDRSRDRDRDRDRRPTSSAPQQRSRDDDSRHRQRVDQARPSQSQHRPDDRRGTTREDAYNKRRRQSPSESESELDSDDLDSIRGKSKRPRVGAGGGGRGGGGGILASHGFDMFQAMGRKDAS